MRFSWTDDQAAFRDAARELLAKECPPSVVRDAWDAPPGALDRSVWTSLEAMGVLAVLVPEAAGGLGLDECALVPILEEAGRAALPHPIVETAMVAAGCGIDVGGRMITASQAGVAPCLLDADAVLVDLGDSLVLVTAPVDGEGLETVDRARRAGRVTRVPDVVEATIDDPTAIELARARGALGTAAQLVGLARAMLDLAVAHVVDRHQFGVPVGSFQAVKHHLADAALAIEFAAPAVARGAWSVAAGEPTMQRDVSMAKALAGDAASVAGRASLQCHGAIGYTVEHDLHLFLKRAWALERAWGDRAFHADQVGMALGI